jgi:hypothetical protein
LIVFVVFMALLLTLLIAAGVVVYVAFPHRGFSVPNAPWLGALVLAPVAFVAHLLPRVESPDHAQD